MTQQPILSSAGRDRLAGPPRRTPGRAWAMLLLALRSLADRGRSRPADAIEPPDRPSKFRRRILHLIGARSGEHQKVRPRRVWPIALTLAVAVAVAAWVLVSGAPEPSSAKGPANPSATQTAGRLGPPATQPAGASNSIHDHFGLRRIVSVTVSQAPKGDFAAEDARSVAKKDPELLTELAEILQQLPASGMVSKSFPPDTPMWRIDLSSETERKHSLFFHGDQLRAPATEGGTFYESAQTAAQEKRLLDFISTEFNPGKIDLKIPGTYVWGKWKYAYGHTADRKRYYGWIYHHDRGLPDAIPDGGYYQTPWGRIHYVGYTKTDEGLTGWMPYVPTGRKEGERLLTPTARWSKLLKENLDQFCMILRYRGKQDEKNPYYWLTLTVPLLEMEKEPGPYMLTVRISPAQAGKIVDHLAEVGLLAEPSDIFNWRPLPPQEASAYLLWVKLARQPNRYNRRVTGGWDLRMLRQLEDLRKVLGSDAAKAMDKLLARLGPVRENWTRTQKLIEALQADRFDNIRSFVFVRDDILPIAREIGDREPISFLAGQLLSEDRRRRCGAAVCLELLGDRRGVPAIIKELRDTGPRPTEMNRSDGKKWVEGQIKSDRYYAALLLGLLADRRAVPALIEATRDKTIHYQAAISLGQIGDKRAIPALRAMRKDFPEQRLWAAYGLAMLGEADGPQALIHAVTDAQRHWLDRRHAAEALGALRARESVGALRKALQDEYGEVREAASRALKRIRMSGPATRPVTQPAEAEDDGSFVVTLGDGREIRIVPDPKKLKGAWATRDGLARRCRELLPHVKDGNYGDVVVAELRERPAAGEPYLPPIEWRLKNLATFEVRPAASDRGTTQPDTPSAPSGDAAKVPRESKEDSPWGKAAHGLPPPEGLRDVGDLLAALTPRIGKGWELSQVDYGRTFPLGWPGGQGFHIIVYDTKAPVAAGKRAPWTDVHVWLMARDYEAKGPLERGNRPTEEIARWRGQRVFLYGGEERWPGRRDNVLAALKAAETDNPRDQAAAIQQRFHAFATFVEKLGPKVHPKWHCQVFRYGSQQLGNPGGPQGWGLHLFLRQRIQAGERVGAEDPYGEAWLWLMDPSFKGQLPKKTEKNFVPDEVGRWRGGRAFLWAFARGEGNWHTVQGDLRAAMQASELSRTGAGEAPTSEPATQPDTSPAPLAIRADFAKAARDILPKAWTIERLVWSGSSGCTLILRDESRPSSPGVHKGNAVLCILPPKAKETPGTADGRGKTYTVILEAQNGTAHLWADPANWRTIHADLAKELVGPPMRVERFAVVYVDGRSFRWEARILPNWLQLRRFGLTQESFQAACRRALTGKPVADLREVWVDTGSHRDMLLTDMADVTIARAAQWVTFEVELKAALPMARTILIATARTQADVYERRTAHFSTASRDGEISGGGDVRFARCRQTFGVTAVLLGEAKPGRRVLEYGFVEASDCFPGPHAEIPIPQDRQVILLLDGEGRLLKALADTAANRAAVVRPATTRPGAASQPRRAGAQQRFERARPTGRPADPAAGADDVDRFLAALKAQMPANWTAEAPQTGPVAPTHWPKGTGTLIRLHRKGHAAEDWKRGLGGEVNVWLMAEGYDGKGPAGAWPAGAQVGPASELAQWCRRRVLVWGSGGDDWRRWEQHIRNALKASWRAAVLLRKIDEFGLEVRFRQGWRKTYPWLVLSVAEQKDPVPPDTVHVRIAPAQARKIVDHLATDGFGWRAVDSEDLKAIGMGLLTGPYYTLSAETSEYACWEWLEWGAPTRTRLIALRAVLDGPAREALDRLIAALPQDDPDSQAATQPAGGDRDAWVRAKLARLRLDDVPILVAALADQNADMRAAIHQVLAAWSDQKIAYVEDARALQGAWKAWWNWRPGDGALSRAEIAARLPKATEPGDDSHACAPRYYRKAEVLVPRSPRPGDKPGKLHTDPKIVERVWTVPWVNDPHRHQGGGHWIVLDAATGKIAVPHAYGVKDLGGPATQAASRPAAPTPISLDDVRKRLAARTGGEWRPYARGPSCLQGLIELKPGSRPAKNTIYLVYPWPGDASGRAKAKERIASWARPMDVIWSNDHWTVLGDTMDALTDPQVAALTKAVLDELKRVRPVPAIPPPATQPGGT